MNQFTAYLPRLVICLTWDAEPQPVKLPYDWTREDGPRNPDMRRSFESAACLRPLTLGPDDLSSIEEHGSVSYLVSSNLYRELDPVYRRVTIEVLMSVIGRALDAGATGVKLESSGLAHSIGLWRTLVDEVATGIPVTGATVADAYRFWGAAFEAFVRYPIGRDAGEAFSCGMHLLAAPDVIMDRADLGSSETAQDVISLFCRHTLTAGGPESVRDGQTYQLAEDGTRWSVSQEACDGYEDDEFFSNPWGRFRLSPVA